VVRVLEGGGGGEGDAVEEAWEDVHGVRCSGWLWWCWLRGGVVRMGVCVGVRVVLLLLLLLLLAATIVNVTLPVGDGIARPEVGVMGRARGSVTRAIHVHDEDAGPVPSVDCRHLIRTYI
jgi:hypothetical protein